MVHVDRTPKNHKGDNKVEMPKYSELVRIIAQIGAVIGCIVGAMVTVAALASFKYGFMVGLSGISGGLYLIFGSLAALGVIYCFLALVQAQIETRNAVIEYIDAATRARER
jgi:hypothetical protein